MLENAEEWVQVPVQVSSSEMAVIMGSTLLLFPSVPSFTVG